LSTSRNWNIVGTEWRFASAAICITSVGEQNIGGDDQRAGPQLDQRCKSCIEIASAAGLQYVQG
jgi:hypothetical protein